MRHGVVWLGARPEESLPEGGTRSSLNVAVGKTRVNIASRLMRPGDIVEISTPNTLVVVEGSVVIAEHSLELGGRSVITLLEGTAKIVPNGQPPVVLTPNTRVMITGTGETGIRVGPVQKTTPAEVAQVEAVFEVGPVHTEEPKVARVVENQLETAVQLAQAIAGRDVDLLVTLPEIGKRTAETMVTELKGKLDRFIEAKPAADGTEPGAVALTGNETAREAVAVLMQLGEPAHQARALVERVIDADPTLATADAMVEAAFRIKALT